MCSLLLLDADLQVEIFDLLDIADRARLACVSRAFRRFCAQHSTTRLRQHTVVAVPLRGWEPYVRGVSRWLAWHARTLRTVHVDFEASREEGRSWADWKEREAQAKMQAEALGWVCCQLRPAEKLCELVLDIDDIFSEAVSERLEELSILTQLSTLVLHNVASDAETEQLVAAVSPLTRLTRLELQFSYGEHGNGDEVPAFPWEEAVCQLIDLQELRVSSGAEHDYYGDPMFKGSLPAALSQLTALRCLEVLGMRDDYERDDSDELLLAELPALEKAALRMFTLSCPYPTLGHQQQAVCSRLVSLSLTLRTDYECTYLDTHLPPIVAPALTELLLDDIKLAPDSEQLSWLPGLPALRRLLLKDLKTASSQLPQGIVACSGLTELVLHRILLSFTMVNDPNKAFDRPECRLRSLPDAGSYLDQLVRLRLSKNAFVAVPPCLASATALQDLDMRKQMLQVEYGEPHSASMRGLHALDSLPRLRSLNIEGFEKSAAGIRRFRAAHPHVRVVFKSED